MRNRKKGRLSVPLSMNFWKSSKVISDPKNFVAKFLALETPIWGGNFRSKKFRRKKSQHFSQKRGGEGGVKGRLELFQKFIDIGTDRLP